MISHVRLAAGVLLLVAAANSVWQTIDILKARRMRRMELAEVSHVRFGLLNADQWVSKIVPVLNRQIDSLDLATSSRASLKPTVERALFRLLDQLKDQLVPKPAPGGRGPTGPAAMIAAAQATIVTNMLNGLRPKVPEFAGVVLTELARPENKKAIREYLREVVTDGAKATFGAVDSSWYNLILKEYRCANAVACQKELGTRIAKLDSEAQYHYILTLAAALLAFFLLPKNRIGVALFALFCVVLLAGGIFTPMIEVEARISQVKLTFFGDDVSFPEQVLYFQSKSVLEVFRTLIDIGQPEMLVVAILVLMFSVVFPAIKTLTIGACLLKPALLENRMAKFFALESSKWSMADVMALAIFMSFVAFNGLIGNAMSGLNGPGAQLVIPTDSSKVLPGFYLFIGFCVASLFLSARLERTLRAAG